MRKAIDIFGEWADIGRDIGMAEGHAVSIDEMLSIALKDDMNCQNLKCI